MQGARQLVDDALVLGVPHAQLHALHQGRVSLFGGRRCVLVVAVALGNRGLDDVRRHTRADGPATAAAVTTPSKVIGVQALEFRVRKQKSTGMKLPCPSLTTAGRHLCLLWTAAVASVTMYTLCDLRL